MRGGVRKGMAVSGEAEQKTQAACPRRRTTPTRARSHCPPSLCAGSGPMGALSFQPPQCSGGPRFASQEDKLRRVTRQGHLVGPRQSQGGNYVPDQLSQRAHLAQCRRFSKSAACPGVSLIPIALVLEWPRANLHFRDRYASLAPSGPGKLPKREPA